MSDKISSKSEWNAPEIDWTKADWKGMFKVDVFEDGKYNVEFSDEVQLARNLMLHNSGEEADSLSVALLGLHKHLHSYPKTIPGYDIDDHEDTLAMCAKWIFSALKNLPELFESESNEDKNRIAENILKIFENTLEIIKMGSIKRDGRGRYKHSLVMTEKGELIPFGYVLQNVAMSLVHQLKRLPTKLEVREHFTLKHPSYQKGETIQRTALLKTPQQWTKYFKVAALAKLPTKRRD